MILVDAGVLIDCLRSKDPKLNLLFRSLPVAVCGVTRAEILAGARSVKDRQRLLVFLNQFLQIPTAESCWELVAETLAVLHATGITVPFPDAVVATLGIENDIEVWARDPHFPMIQKVIPALKLFSEPP
jgi:predicted nucleic acid-binding protein